MRYFLFLNLLLFSSCRYAEKKDILSSPVFQNDLLSNYRSDLSVQQVEKLIDLGLYLPFDSTCATNIKIKPEQRFDFLSVFENKYSSPDSAVYYSVWSLYQLFGDPIIPVEFEYAYLDYSVQDIINLLKIGQCAPQCEGASQLAKHIIEKKFRFEATIEVVKLTTVEHTLNMATFTRNGLNYKVIFDVQNGFLFPFNQESREFMSQDAVDKIEIDKITTKLLWLPDSVLLRKRNFLDDVLPCNFLTELGKDYHLTPQKSPYEYELIGKSFHKMMWFDLEQIDDTAFCIELQSIIQSN